LAEASHNQWVVDEISHFQLQEMAEKENQDGVSREA
jgi:hypothetical protein